MLGDWLKRRRIKRMLKNICEKKGYALKKRPKIRGIPYRPDFIIETKTNQEIVIKIFDHLLLMDLVEIVDIISARATEVENKFIWGCCIADKITEAVWGAAPKYNIYLIDELEKIEQVLSL